MAGTFSFFDIVIVCEIKSLETFEALFFIMF